MRFREQKKNLSLQGSMAYDDAIGRGATAEQALARGQAIDQQRAMQMAREMFGGDGFSLSDSGGFNLATGEMPSGLFSGALDSTAPTTAAGSDESLSYRQRIAQQLGLDPYDDIQFGNGAAADTEIRATPVNLALAERLLPPVAGAVGLAALGVLGRSDIPQLSDWANQQLEAYKRSSMQSDLNEFQLRSAPATPTALLNAEGSDWHPDIRDAVGAYQHAAEINDPIMMERSMAKIQMAVTTRIDPDALKNNSGPVVHVAIPDATLFERGQYLAHAIGANFELARGNVVPRLPEGNAVLEDFSSRKKFTESIRLENPQTYFSKNIVVGHVPDIIWTGKINGFTMPMTSRVNTSIGQQNYNYPAGYMPKVFLSVDVFRKPVTPNLFGI